MTEKYIKHALFRLGNRMNRNANLIQDASLGKLSKLRRRALRHLAEINKIRDFWADHQTRSRRPKIIRPPCPCAGGNYWQTRLFRGRREFR